MFPKNLRLDSTEIPNIARRGKKSEDEYLTIKTWFDDSLASPQFAISISVRVDKRASVRNLIKRRIRAAILELVREEKIRKAKYLIIVKNDQLKAFKSTEVAKLLERLI